MTDLAVLDPESPDVRGLAEISSNELRLAEEMGLDLTADVDARLERVVTKTNTAMRLVVEAGLDLLSIKGECAHGEFETLLAERGISSQRASEMMRMARVTANLSPAERQKVMALSKSKAMLLARTDPELLQQAMEDDEEFEELTSMSYRAMRDRIRALETQNANLTTDLDTAETQNDALKARLKKERTDSTYPDFVVVTRHEANALSEQALQCIDDLGRLSGDLLQLEHGTGFYEASPENAQHLQVAASSLAVHLQAILAKGSAALKHLVEHMPAGAIGPVNAELLYSDEEVHNAVEGRLLMVREHHQEAQLREQQRQMNKPRGRGRPRKVQE